MDSKVFRAALLNLPVAADVDTTSLVGTTKIRGLAPFLAKDYIGYKETVAVVEVPQKVKIGEVTLAVIAASTKYQLQASMFEKEFEWMGIWKKYGTTSPAVLSGSAFTDRWNVYTQLAYRINRGQERPRFYAGAIAVLTHVASTAFTVTAGKSAVWIVGATSGCIGFVIANADSTTTSTTICVVNGIAPVVGDIFTTMNNPYSKTLDGAGGPSTAVTVVVLGAGLRIIDLGNYYDPLGLNKSASVWKVTSGLAANNISVSTAAVYSVGQPGVLAKMIPQIETSSSNLLAGGVSWFPVNEPVLTTTSYNYIDVFSKITQNNSALGDSGSVAVVTQRLVLDKNAAGYAAFLAAVAAL